MKYSAVKVNEIQIHTTTWMNLQNMLSKNSQAGHWWLIPVCNPSNLRGTEQEDQSLRPAWAIKP
jgi:hypothetical protein